MTSVCRGCAHEEACGHADATACANRVPAAWCSCDPLRKARAERDALMRLKLEREAEVSRLEGEIAAAAARAVGVERAARDMCALIVGWAAKLNELGGDRPDDFEAYPMATAKEFADRLQALVVDP